MMNLILVHGWGFDRKLWDDVIALLPRNLDIYFVDFGFTGKETGLDDLPENALCIGHSMGVLWLLKHVKKPLSFVSIGGFDCFYKYVSPSQTQAMKDNLENNLMSQMKGFYKACGVPFINYDFDKDKLLWGLNFLENKDGTSNLKNIGCPVVSLIAEDDVIVPISMSKNIWSSFDCKFIKSGGHILPLTQSDFCAHHINKLIEKLK